MFGYVSFRNIRFLSNITVKAFQATQTFCLTSGPRIKHYAISILHHLLNIYFTYIVDYISLKYIILSLNCSYFIVIFSCVV